MGARPVAIENARIVDFEGAFLVVEAPVVGRLLVPSEMIDDDSEVWRVGDAGTILVAGAWAKQRGIKGKRKSRAVSAPVAGAPVELVRKAAVLEPEVMVGGAVRVTDVELARARVQRKRKQQVAEQRMRGAEERPQPPSAEPYYNWRQVARMQRLLEEIRAGVPSAHAKGSWERQQELILRTYYVGWNWEQLLERMRQGYLLAGGGTLPDPNSKRTQNRVNVAAPTVQHPGGEVSEKKSRPYYQARREARMRRLWEDIQSGSSDGAGLTSWEQRQSHLLRTRCVGWTWEQVLECMQQGPLEEVTSLPPGRPVHRWLCPRCFLWCDPGAPCGQCGKGETA